MRARCRERRKERGGRDPCLTGPGGMRGTGEGDAAVPALFLAPRIPALPGSGSPPAASSLMSCRGERSAGSGLRRSWEGSGLSPAHFQPCFPASLPLRFAPRSRKQGAAGEEAAGAGSGSPLCPGPAEVPAGRCRSRPCLRAPFPCLGPEGTS